MALLPYIYRPLKNRSLKKAAFSILFLLPLMCFAQLTVPRIFADNMIIQRDRPVAIWGTALPGENISIRLGQATKHTIADNKGKWKTSLKVLKAGGPYQLDISGAKGEKIEIKNIKAGDVWICAGQSNMNFMLAADKNGSREMAGLDNDNIREFRTAMPAGILNPENRDSSKWVAAVGKDAETFSAVAWYFAKHIQSAANIPVGIVVMSCGNTRAESWTDTVALNSEPRLAPLMAYWAKHKADKDANPNHVPGKFYNEVVSPIIPFAAKGVIWYQGESNTLPDNSGRSITERAAEYKPLLKTLINNWRNAWGDNTLPFYLVQLPNYSDPSGDIQWARIRQAQLETSLEVGHTAMAVTIDLGDPHNIHPNNKKPVGDRLALLALAKQYNITQSVISGPVIKNIKVKGNEATLTFNYTGKGLTAADTTNIKGFEIADTLAPEKFVPANARLKDNKLLIRATSVNHPAAVRYAWADDPQVSLYNADGLPASPFLIKTK